MAERHSDERPRRATGPEPAHRPTTVVQRPSHPPLPTPPPPVTRTAPLSPAPPPMPRKLLTGGVEVAPGVRVLTDALRFAYARSSGPGGQNVNKVATKAQLRIRLADLPLHPEALARLRASAGFRLVGAPPDEELLLSSEAERSQEANREHTLAELRRLLIAAMKRPKTRRATKPSRGAKLRRLSSKKHRGDIKRNRSGPID